MSKCSNCGTQLEEGARFCPKCGANAYRVQEQIGSEDPSHMQTVNDKTEDKVIDVEAKEFRYREDGPEKLKVSKLCLIGPTIALPGLFSYLHVIGIAAVVVSIIGYLQAERMGQKGKEAAAFGMVLGAVELGVFLTKLLF